jgi:hypothetical protein
MARRGGAEQGLVRSMRRTACCLGAWLALAGVVAIAAALSLAAPEESDGLVELATAVSAWHPSAPSWKAFTDAGLQLHVEFRGEEDGPVLERRSVSLVLVREAVQLGAPIDRLVPSMWHDAARSGSVLSDLAAAGGWVARFDAAEPVPVPLALSGYSARASVSVRIESGTNASEDSTGPVFLFGRPELAMGEAGGHATSPERCSVLGGIAVVESRLCYTFKRLTALCLRVRRSGTGALTLTHDSGVIGCQWRTAERGSPAYYAAVRADANGTLSEPTRAGGLLGPLAISVMSQQDPLVLHQHLEHQGRLVRADDVRVAHLLLLAMGLFVLAAICSAGPVASLACTNGCGCCGNGAKRDTAVYSQLAGEDEIDFRRCRKESPELDRA